MTEHRYEDDVVDGLTEDHREALALLDEIITSDDAEQRRELADVLITEVVRHSVAEEMYVYPAMRKHLPDAEDDVQHDVQEHKELEKIMKDLEQADASGEQFMSLVREMADALRHHADDEETEQFPRLRDKVPHDELVELRRKVEKAKEMAPTRPHPHAPNTELFHKLVGPGVGLVDRARDKLTTRAST